MLDDMMQTIMEKLESIEELAKMAVCANCTNYENESCWLCYKGNRFERKGE